MRKKLLGILCLAVLCVAAFVAAACSKQVKLVDFADGQAEADYGTQYTVRETVSDEEGNSYQLSASVTEKKSGDPVTLLNGKFDVLSLDGYTIVYTAHTDGSEQKCTIELKVKDNTVPEIRFSSVQTYGDWNQKFELPSYEIKEALVGEVEVSERLYLKENGAETEIPKEQYESGVFVPQQGGNYTYEITAMYENGNEKVGNFDFYIRMVAPGEDEVESFNDECALRGVRADGLEVLPYSKKPVDGVTDYLALKGKKDIYYSYYFITTRYPTEYYLDRDYSCLSYKIYIDPDTVTEKTKKFETLPSYGDQWGGSLEVEPGKWQEVFVDFNLLRPYLENSENNEIRIIKNILNDNNDGRTHDPDMVFYISDVKFRKNIVSEGQLVNPAGDIAEQYVMSEGVKCVKESVGGMDASFSVALKENVKFAVKPVQEEVLDGHNRVAFKIYAQGEGSVQLTLASGESVTAPLNEWTLYMVNSSAFIKDMEKNGFGELFTVKAVSGNITGLYVSEIVAYQEMSPTVELEMKDSLGIVNKEFILPEYIAVDADGEKLPDAQVEIELKNIDTQETLSPADGKFVPKVAGTYEYTVRAINGDKTTEQKFTFYVSDSSKALHADKNAETSIEISGNAVIFVEEYEGKAALKLNAGKENWPALKFKPQRPLSDYKGCDTFVITLRIDGSSFGSGEKYASRIVEINGGSLRVPVDTWFSLSTPIASFYDESGAAKFGQFFVFWTDRNWPGCEQDTFSIYVAGVEAVKKEEQKPSGNSLLNFKDISIVDSVYKTAPDQWGNGITALYMPEVAEKENVVAWYISQTNAQCKIKLPGSADLSGYAYLEFDLYLQSEYEKQVLFGGNVWNGGGDQAFGEHKEYETNKWITVRIPVSVFNAAGVTDGYTSLFCTTNPDYGFSEDIVAERNWFIYLSDVRGIMAE